MNKASRLKFFALSDCVNQFVNTVLPSKFWYRQTEMKQARAMETTLCAHN